MTARHVRREVDRERCRLADFERQIAVAETAYRAEAAKPRANIGPLNERYDEHAVGHARNRVARLRAEHETTQIRIDVLSAHLPSPEQVREARPEAERLLVQLRERNQSLAETWTQFLSAVAAVETAARELASALQADAEIRTRASALIEQFDLDLLVPAAPEVDRRARQRVQLVLALAQQAMSGRISPMTESTLAQEACGVSGH